MRDLEPYYPGLTRLRARLWHALVKSKGRIVQYPELAYAVYGCDADASTIQLIRNLVRFIRQQYGEDSIITVTGYGYVLGNDPHAI